MRNYSLLVCWKKDWFGTLIGTCFTGAIFWLSSFYLNFMQGVSTEYILCCNSLFLFWPADLVIVLHWQLWTTDKLSRLTMVIVIKEYVSTASPWTGKWINCLHLGAVEYLAAIMPINASSSSHQNNNPLNCFIGYYYTQSYHSVGFSFTLGYFLIMKFWMMYFWTKMGSWTGINYPVLLICRFLVGWHSILAFSQFNSNSFIWSHKCLSLAQKWIR